MAVKFHAVEAVGQVQQAGDLAAGQGADHLGLFCERSVLFGFLDLRILGGIGAQKGGLVSGDDHAVVLHQNGCVGSGLQNGFVLLLRLLVHLLEQLVRGI